MVILVRHHHHHHHNHYHHHHHHHHHRHHHHHHHHRHHHQRNRRATPLLRSPRLVGTVCCRTSYAPNKKMKYLDALVVVPLAFSNCHSGSSSFFFNTNSFIFSSSCSAQGRLFDTAAHHSHSVSQPLARPTTCRTLWRWRQWNTQQCWRSLVPCTVALQSRGTLR